jgi:hypothetical protein
VGAVVFEFTRNTRQVCCGPGARCYVVTFIYAHRDLLDAG